MKTFFKKQKEKLVAWLLKGINLGFTIDSNELNNCSFKNSSINLNTVGNIVIDKANLPEDVEVIIRKKKSENE